MNFWPDGFAENNITWEWLPSGVHTPALKTTRFEITHRSYSCEHPTYVIYVSAHATIIVLYFSNDKQCYNITRVMSTGVIIVIMICTLIRCSRCVWAGDNNIVIMYLMAPNNINDNYHYRNNLLSRSMMARKWWYAVDRSAGRPFQRVHGLCVWFITRTYWALIY